MTDETAHTLTEAPDVESLINAMTLEEKVAQLVGLWIGVADGGEVAPAQAENTGRAKAWAETEAEGLGQITRLYGTRPVSAQYGLETLRRLQAGLRDAAPHGIGAIVHEECLTGVAAWGATTFPSPPAYAATWDPELIERVGAAIGDSLQGLEVHQGLAPVLDVARDARWGRTEETFGEDPYVVGTLGAAYIRGLESRDIIATPKHFVGYSASRAGRNHAPVDAGPRELAEVFLYPFEVAIREGSPRSIMPSYSAIDHVPSHGDKHLLTDVLRTGFGFDGTVVSDYFGVNFLQTTQGVTRSRAESAVRAISAGVDVELPDAAAFPHLVAAVRSGDLEEEAVDAALRRVLLQKQHYGLLPAGFAAAAGYAERAGTEAVAPDLNPAAHRDLAREVAEKSIILLANDGTLPLESAARIAVVGPNADSRTALLGDYSFTNHVEAHYPDVAAGIDIPTVLDALRNEFPSLDYARGCEVEGDDAGGFDAAVAQAGAADVVVAVMGDQAGLFGRGTVGEGNDVDSLELPGVQRRFVEALLDTGKPVVLVLITGRPYDLSWAADRCAAIVQSWFPGQEGASAVAGALSGRINPRGRTTLSYPGPAGRQPATYLRPALAGTSAVTSLGAEFVFPFGHGLSYTTFTHSSLILDAHEIDSTGTLQVAVKVQNTGERDGTDVVQLYVREVTAHVTRPVSTLIGYAAVDIEAGGSRTVTFTVSADRLSYVGQSGQWEIGPLEATLAVAHNAEDDGQNARIAVTGQRRILSSGRVLTTPVAVSNE
ncbi:beta-glucosidase [Arthrobacter sunyaminii]|uniref:Glycoside hydrolase family 3 C-terminal domain-containing protein n=1 Tax=Arthrobacter sunyaminii TaxID=2816859 RepID=A0A975PEC6_9MICC|nr:glycoside hydrolase family 3 N-terminal domain-containing protein [Arthrobacter sunyaminii]MBO0908954.1 glycoside hydrolase family 3 C-terminal domain-containing protein [Arthrobacter sunyaminii]QWQ35544.1 glycoside hydrolase family 3 C-terminal domain-containing protein [Arthrobacter sunyaminii]